jgi:hypothetical protein
MLEVAEIIRHHGAAYRARFGPSVGPSQRRALRELAACRTPACGGHVHQCDQCGPTVYAYHSCRNRHCPKCHRSQTARWLTAQRARLLPCAYYLLTFTLPSELRALARDHPKALYGLLMRSAAAALQTLARDPRYVGGRLGILGVLHTWTRALLYHPHVHLLVTAGGLASDGTEWLAPKHPAYLVPVQALSVLFRAKVGAGLKRGGLLEFRGHHTHLPLPVRIAPYCQPPLLPAPDPELRMVFPEFLVPARPPNILNAGQARQRSS